MKRNPLIAALLAIFHPGTAALYNTKGKKSLFYFIAFPALFVAVLTVVMHGPFLVALVLGIASITFRLFVIVEQALFSYRNKEIELTRFNRWYYYLLMIGLGLIIEFGLRNVMRSILSDEPGIVFSIPANSMAPEVEKGDIVFVDKYLRRISDFKRGDLIVFFSPPNPNFQNSHMTEKKALFTKRVIALPGDRVELIANQVKINGERVEEPYVARQFEISVENFEVQRLKTEEEMRQKGITITAKRPSISLPKDEALVIPDNMIFVMGDNRIGSYDSRHFGPVDESYLFGKVVFKLKTSKLWN